MPSTLVAFRMTSAPISFARSAAVVSVEKNGLPVPATKMTTCRRSSWSMARRRMNGSATLSMWIAVWTRVGEADVLEGALQGQAVDDRGEHAHVVGGGALHAAMAGAQSAPDIAAADDDRDLHAEVVHFFDLRADLLDDLRAKCCPRCPRALSASPLSFRTMRWYLGLGDFADFARAEGLGIARRVNTNAARAWEGKFCASAAGGAALERGDGRAVRTATRPGVSTKAPAKSITHIAP